MSVPLAGLAVLVSVWGRRHVDEFLRLALPSWLAPGNLPALAQAAGGPVELLVMSGQSDIEAARDAPAIRALDGIARVSWIPIDDLIAPPAYTTTLTLAFARGVALRESEAFGTPIVFLNSDFVLADGALASVARALAEGHRAILAPSLRAGCRRPAEAALAELATGQAGIARSYMPRALVRLALDDLHPTVLGALADQAALASDHPNQFAWRLDEGTLLARSLLMFPLAARPTRRWGPVGGFCDFDMLDRLAPGEAKLVMADSDAFFALEAAEPEQQMEMLRAGPLHPQDAARSLGAWLTPALRPQAEADLLFHAGAVDPARLAAGRVAAGAFLARIDRHLPPALSEGPHPYWTASLGFWRDRRRAMGGTDWAPELGPHDPAVPEPRRVRLLREARRSLRGAPGLRPFPWQGGYRALLVLRTALAETGPARRLDDGTLAALLGPPDATGGQALLCALPASTLETGGGDLQAMAETLAPGTPLLVLLRATEGQRIRPVDLARLLTLLPGCRAVSITTAGVVEEALARRAQQRAAAHFARRGVARRLAALLGLSWALARLALAQLSPPRADDAAAVLVRFERKAA
jgi:hypothetical protein